jgi:hypothetical protein
MLTESKHAAHRFGSSALFCLNRPSFMLSRSPRGWVSLNSVEYLAWTSSTCATIVQHI